MKIYDVEKLAVEEGGEYVLGSEELKTHACYLVYGILNPGERDRQIKPGRGHEEIFTLMNGEVTLSDGGRSFRLSSGQSFHLRGEEMLLAKNTGTERVVYVIAGGHSEVHDHH